MRELKALNITARGSTIMRGVPAILDRLFRTDSDASFHLIVVSDGVVDHQAETLKEAHRVTNTPFPCTISGTLLRFKSST